MERRYPGEGHQAINAFNYTEVPIITTLAREFAVFDQWFCDVPGIYNKLTQSQAQPNQTATTASPEPPTEKPSTTLTKPSWATQ